MQALREACAAVAARASQVQIEPGAIAGYAASLQVAPWPDPAPASPGAAASQTSREAAAAFWLTLDAINFGSGWFPTLRKRPGLSGYNTIAAGL
jgi:hypothetical protein